MALFGLRDYNFFGEFKCMFKWMTFELNFYYIHVGARILFGVLLGAASSSFYCGIAVSAGLCIVSLVIILRKPYSDILQSVRSAANMWIGAIIFILYTIAAITGPTNGSTFYSRIPIVIVGLLFAVVLLALGFVIRQYIVDVKKYL